MLSANGIQLTVAAKAYGTARIFVYAIDGSGRGAQAEMYVTVPQPNDTVTVTLDDQSGNPIAAGTRYYCRLFNGTNSNSMTAATTG